MTKIAKDMGVSLEDVERAYKAPFELQSIIMRYRCDREKLHFPSLRVPYFLIFYCPPWTKKRLQRYKDNNNEIVRPDK